MGNCEGKMGNKTSNICEQESTENEKKDYFYHLVNLEGEGILVEIAREADKSKDFAELDKIIKCKVEPFLYNAGSGKQFPTSQLIQSKRGSKHKEQSNKNGVEMDRMSFTCWRLDRRGVVGETGLHVCLLMDTMVHASLAKR